MTMFLVRMFCPFDASFNQFVVLKEDVFFKKMKDVM